MATGVGDVRQAAVRRGVRDALILLGLAFLAFQFLVLGPKNQGVGSDAYAYWSVNPAAPYGLGEGTPGAFSYSPPLARLFAPASVLSWPDFWWLWTALLVATVVWLGWRRTLWVLAFPPVAFELYHGNVNLFIAAAIALGFRYPAAWAFVLLTKVTPGVGLVWFVVRREWRSLAIALGVTAVIVAVSLAIDGPLWSQWLVTLAGAPDELGGPLAIPLIVRLPLAVLVVGWGAQTDRRWTVPVAATLAMPVLFVAVFSVLAAVMAVDRPELRPKPTYSAA